MLAQYSQMTIADSNKCRRHMRFFSDSKSRRGLSLFSPDGGFKFEEFLGGLDDPGVVRGQDTGTQKEADIPVALQLVQTAFFPHQAAQLHS